MALELEHLALAPPAQVHIVSSESRSRMPQTQHQIINNSLRPDRHVPDGQSFRKYIRYRLFDIYKRLFTFIVLLNLSVLIYVVSEHSEPNLDNVLLLSTPIAFNLFLAILFRTEDFINLLFKSVLWVPRSLPLSVRRALAKVYQFGGIHSGAGVACTSWALMFAVQATRAFTEGRGIGVGVVTVTYLIFALLVFIVASAQPSFRRLQHDYFEAIHRFCGWSALLFYWALTLVLTKNLSEVQGKTFVKTILGSAPIYFLLASTIMIILPWLRLRRITVQATTPSNHLTRLYFPRPGAKPTQTVRISTNPLMEWHSFAILPLPEESSSANHPSLFPHSFSILISSAGDWTRSVIAEESQTRTYWIRGIPTTGVTVVTRLFNRAIVVATGSGIGPILSLLTAAHRDNNGKRTECHLIWSTQAPEVTYGDELMQEVYKADPNATVWDTQKRGRPDLTELIIKQYKDFNAEAVMVVSNQVVTKRIVFGLELKGIPAYGPIFDS